MGVSEMEKQTRDTKTNSSSHLKIDDWKTILSFLGRLIRVIMLVSGRPAKINGKLQLPLVHGLIFFGGGRVKDF